MAELLQCDRCGTSCAGHVERVMGHVASISATGWRLIEKKLLCSRCMDALVAWLQREANK